MGVPKPAKQSRLSKADCFSGAALLPTMKKALPQLGLDTSFHLHGDASLYKLILLSAVVASGREMGAATRFPRSC